MKTTLSLSLFVLLAGPAAALPAQISPGDLVLRANPNGNTVAIHSPAGPLLARSDGVNGDWRMGVALTHDYGWVTFNLDVNASPQGWHMLRYDPNGVLISDVSVPQIAEVAQYGVDRSVDGVILVADASRGRVHKYAQNGTFLGYIDAAAVGASTHALEPMADGGFWLFASGWLTPTFAEGIRFDRLGNVIATVNLGDDIEDVEALADGTFWTTKSYSPDVSHWDANGALIESFQFDLGVTPAGQLRSPNSTATLPDGTLWIGVGLSEQLTRVDTSGNILESFNSAADYGVTEVRLVRPRPGLGEVTCPGVPNQTGSAGQLIATGTLVIVDNEFTLSASDLPRNTFGVFLASRTSGFTPNPGGSQGNLCLGNSIGRFLGPGQIANSGSQGRIEIDAGLMSIPTPQGPVTVQPGETWNFQCWHRDTVQGTPTSNFTNGIEVAFV